MRQLQCFILQYDNMRSYTTIKDIARELGVSPSTVSRALADSGEVSEKMKGLVKTKAEEMNYHPNVLARNLSSRKSGVIGVIVPEFETGFFPRVILGIQDTLAKEGYRILITQSGESAQKERENLELLLGNMVEGIIVSVAKEGGNDDAFREVIRSQIPVVFFNRVYNLPKASKVIVDDKSLAYASVCHLFEQGCRNIVHFAGPQNLEVAKKRAKGYMEAMCEFGNGEDAEIVEAGITFDDGDRVVTQLLNGGEILPDAIFCFNDNLAIGAMRALKKAGFRIPQDVAVVGFSETELSTIVEPNLTTTVQPRYQMGVEAAKIMVEQIRTRGRSIPTNLTLEGHLNIRESSKIK